MVESEVNDSGLIECEMEVVFGTVFLVMIWGVGGMAWE